MTEPQPQPVMFVGWVLQSPAGPPHSQYAPGLYAVPPQNDQFAYAASLEMLASQKREEQTIKRLASLFYIMLAVGFLWLLFS